MTWAKLDVAWYEGESFDAAADLVPRAEALAAWAVLLAWTVGARTDGRLSRRKAIRIVEQQVEPANAVNVVEALERAGLLIPCDEYLAIAGWSETQTTKARQAEIEEGLVARQAKYRAKTSVAQGAHVTRSSDALLSETVTRSVDALDRKKEEKERRERREETRVRATESASLVEPIVSPVIQVQAPTLPAPKPETARPTPSTLSPAASAILAELERHPGLGSVATADLATAIEGRRIASGRPLPHVLAAIGDCAAKAVEGTQAQALRSMLVGFTDRAGPRAPRAPVAQSAPVERAWSVGEVRVEVPA